MNKISQMKLSDLYKLRKIWKDGLKVSVQTQFTKDSMQLRNNKTGKDIFFSYNKVFKDCNPFFDGDRVFVHYTKTQSDGANKAKFIMKDGKNISSSTTKVDGYPFKNNQLCFLNDKLLQGEYLETFIRNYVDKFIEYREKDASPSEIKEAKSVGGYNETYNLYGTDVWIAPQDGSLSTVEQEMLQESKNKTKEGKEMNTNNTLTNAAQRAQEVTARAIEINKEAAILAAKLEVGRTVTTQIKEKITFGWFADKKIKKHPLFDIALANLVGATLRELMPENEKAQVVGEAMVQSAMIEMGREFDLNSYVEDILKNIDVSKLMPVK